MLRVGSRLAVIGMGLKVVTNSFNARMEADTTLASRCQTPTSVDSKHLIGCGMRRKLFFDVYMAALYADEKSVKQLQKRLQDKVTTISEALLNDHGKSSATILLSFRRNVSKAQFIDAILQAFDGFTPSEVGNLRQFFESVVQSDLKVGDIVEISWLVKGGFMMKKNDGQALCFDASKEAYTRLLEVYLDPKRSVAPDLIMSTIDTVLQLK